MVVDSIGRYHVLWQDAIDGFIYTTGGPDGWNEPRAPEFPFFTRRFFPELQPQSATPQFLPYLIADQNGSIHAFWVDTVTDPAGILTHSQVSASNFAQFDAWSAPQALESGGFGPAVAATGNRLHLAYIRRLDSPERPAGVYYRSLPLDSGAWSAGRPLYESRYLRGVTSETANVSIAISSTNQVFVAWDDPAREQVFVSRSSDGGSSWEAPFEIDRRGTNDPADTTGPSGIRVGIANDMPVLMWKGGHEVSSTCSQYFRVIPAEATTWSTTQLMTGLDGCFLSTQLIYDGESLFLLGTMGPVSASGTPSTLTTYLMAWDGAQWSEPQTQEALSNFVNPDTNQPLNLQCQTGSIHLDSLSIVSCDRGVGGDVWWTYRQIGPTAAWFPPPAEWVGPAAVAATGAPIAGLGMVADANGRSHILWHEEAGEQIYQSYRDDTGWSSVRVVASTTAGSVEALATGGNGGRIFMAFLDEQGLYFAQADANQPSEWSVPLTLTDERVDISNIFFLTAQNGDLLIAYTVALNEPRGVYLLRSDDLGLNWSTPSQTFSGAVAEWEAVGQPYLAETADGQLHALWTQRALPPDTTSVGLAYSRSGDGGATWTPLNEIVNVPVLWASLLTYGERVVHLLWAEAAGDRMMLWHSQSPDSGATWSEGIQIGSLDSADLPTATIDPTGQIHIVGLEGGRLFNWRFNGTTWETDDALAINLADGGQLGAAIDITGRLVAGYGLAIPSSGAGQASGGLFAMERPLDLPAAALPTPPPPAATPTPGPTVAPTTAPEATPTIVLPTAPDSNPLSIVPGSGSRSGQLAIAVIPAALVVLVAVLIGVRAIRRGGR